MILEETVKLVGAEQIGKDINFADFTGSNINRAFRYLESHFAILGGRVNGVGKKVCVFQNCFIIEKFMLCLGI